MLRIYSKIESKITELKKRNVELGFFRALFFMCDVEIILLINLTTFNALNDCKNAA